MHLRDYQQQGIADIRQAFIDGIKRVCYVAPCGSGKGTMVAYMAREAARRGNQVLFLIHRQELISQIQEDIGEPHPLIQLEMVQTAVRRLYKIKKPILIISDEFHHGLAATWRKIFNYFSDAYLVGLTATAARTNGAGLGEICDKLIIGPSVKELIARKYLALFHYYAPPVPVDLTGIKIKMGDFDQAEIAIRMDQPHITGSAIQHYKDLADGKQAIVYCASIQHSKNTVAQFIAAGYNARHVDGETQTEERRRAVDEFKNGGLTIMSNVMLFGEGLNLPGVETVILLRPTNSETLHLQQAMRSMRPGPNKTAIIIDAVGNCFRNGLVDEDREWTLEGHQRKKKGEVSTVFIKSCPQCFSVHAPSGECPYCGHVYEVEVREVNVSEGELKEIQAIEKKAKRMEVGMARSIADLKQIAAERNYKNGWVYQMARLKGIKK